jgi:hypothetical protein
MSSSGSQRLFPDRSFWLKRDRAEHHLEELKAAMNTYVGTRQHVVTERYEPKNSPDQQWTYSASVDGQPDQGWALIVGDILFNLRCALDHMAVALNPPKKKRDVYFPLFTENPWACEAGSRRYLQRDPTNRRNFR